MQKRNHRLKLIKKVRRVVEKRKRLKDHLLDIYSSQMQWQFLSLQIKIAKILINRRKLNKDRKINKDRKKMIVRIALLMINKIRSNLKTIGRQSLEKRLMNSAPKTKPRIWISHTYLIVPSTIKKKRKIVMKINKNKMIPIFIKMTIN